MASLSSQPGGMRRGPFEMEFKCTAAVATSREQIPLFLAQSVTGCKTMATSTSSPMLHRIFIFVVRVTFIALEWLGESLLPSFKVPFPNIRQLPWCEFTNCQYLPNSRRPHSPRPLSPQAELATTRTRQCGKEHPAVHAGNRPAERLQWPPLSRFGSFKKYKAP